MASRAAIRRAVGACVLLQQLACFVRAQPCKVDKDCPATGQCCGGGCIGPSPDHICCVNATGERVRCGPGNDQCSQHGYLDTAPGYHVRDRSCGENDPNGPVFDERHGIYHLFYQDHLDAQGGSGPVYGHAVSKDLIKWAHLPVAVWNDQPYDHVAIFSGSATVVGGEVGIAQVYPGIGTPDVWPGCPMPDACISLVLAVPADGNDPLATNWTKTRILVNNTARDPSTAWRTPAGEWRMTTFSGKVYGSMDFLEGEWYEIGMQPGFEENECPSFFPLPRNTPGAGAPRASSSGLQQTPTHVYKTSHGFGNGDTMTVGVYTPNSPKQNGTWVPLAPPQRIDAGRSSYAAKDFAAPMPAAAAASGQRRINWAWANVPPDSVQTLPREVTWNPELEQLVFSPVDEQAQLRVATLAQLSDAHAGTGGGGAPFVPFFVSETASDQAGSTAAPEAEAKAKVEAKTNATTQMEMEVSFAIPSGPMMMGVTVANFLFFVDYNLSGPATEIVEVNVGAHHLNDTAAAAAAMYSQDKAAGNASRTAGPSRSPAAISAISRLRLRDPPYAPYDAPTVSTLRLSPRDERLTFRLFVDHTLTECYFQGGRTVMTIQTSALTTANSSSSGAGVGVRIANSSSGGRRSPGAPPSVAFNASVWAVGSIWTTPEEVARRN